MASKRLLERAVILYFVDDLFGLFVFGVLSCLGFVVEGYRLVLIVLLFVDVFGVAAVMGGDDFVGEVIVVFGSFAERVGFIVVGY